MRLSKIVADPGRFQKRDTPYSQKTVDAILAEGIVLAKFDPLPLLDAGEGRYVVGGDGHSRYEAITRLAATGRLPKEWARWDQLDWEIPHKLVDETEARDLAWTGNLRGNAFTPCEESRIFQEMLDAGIPLDKVATQCHVSEGYIKKSLPLNGLCHAIRQMVGASPDAGGIDKHVAQTMAERFQRHGIAPAQQQELWVKVLCHADLTVQFVRSFLDTVGAQLAGTSKTEDGFLFEIPASVGDVMRTMKDRAQHLRQASRGLAWLMQCRETGVLDTLFPELRALLDAKGAEGLARIKEAADSDGKLVGVVCNNLATPKPAATLIHALSAAA